MQSEPYRRAQAAMAELKAAVLALLEGQSGGLTNAVIGRSLGIYGGHKGHEGHISRTVLAMLESEGVVEQNPSDQTWSLRGHINSSPD
jgi:hypothetical protein